MTTETRPALQVNLDLYQASVEALASFQSESSSVLPTEIVLNERLSEIYGAEIYFASELHQVIGAYKIRGAENRIRTLTPLERTAGMVACSAGNHARGIALRANKERIPTSVFMPVDTPENKINGVKQAGGDIVDVITVGKNFDSTEAVAEPFAINSGKTYIHPFNDIGVIAEQGTLGLEIAKKIPDLEILISPVGGGGLIAGVGNAIKHHNPDVMLVGAEPEGAASMSLALELGQPMYLDDLDTYVDGAAVKRVGKIPFQIAKNLIDRMVVVEKLSLRRAVTEFWEEGEYKPELAGALSRPVLDNLSEEIVGKKVVCLLTGGCLSEERYLRSVKVSF
jgi:threonine dehydratase